MSVPISASPIFWGIGSALMQCQPTNVFYFLMSWKSCNSTVGWNGIQEIILGMIFITVVIVTNGLIFYSVVTLGLAFGTQLIIGVVCIRGNLKVATKAVRERNLGSIKLVHEIYIKNRILTDAYNFVHRGVVLHVMAVGCMGMVCLTYVNIVCRSTLPTFLTVVCFVVNVEGTGIIAGIFGFGSEVHSCSKDCLEAIQRKWIIMKHKQWKINLKSQPVLKIHIGSMNFIERDTVLNIGNFSLCRLIDLLLLGGRE
ncbi:unnamed protein product [Orchesella dallaii]|uniref:Uncharacterized protein n=1 Tax=Orchesella dallaii TaxID=48710 RepID=A0ABP1RLM1_9HEXA